MPKTRINISLDQDLADFAKRESKFEEARNLFHIVSTI